MRRLLHVLVALPLAAAALTALAQDASGVRPGLVPASFAPPVQRSVSAIAQSVAATDVVDGNLAAGAAVREVMLPPVRGEGIAAVWRASLAEGAVVEVERLVRGEQTFLRLAARDAGGERVSAWAAHEGESSPWIALHAGGQRDAFALAVDGALIEVPRD